MSYSRAHRRRARRHGAAHIAAQWQWWRVAERALRRWIAQLQEEFPEVPR